MFTKFKGLGFSTKSILFDLRTRWCEAIKWSNIILSHSILLRMEKYLYESFHTTVYIYHHFIARRYEAIHTNFHLYMCTITHLTNSIGMPFSMLPMFSSVAIYNFKIVITNLLIFSDSIKQRILTLEVMCTTSIWFAFTRST